MPQPIEDFEIIDQDDTLQVRDLGELTYKGVTMQVESHAFNFENEGYDHARADIMLIRTEGTTNEAWHELMGETYLEGGILSALQKFMEETVTGKSNVCWGESGAQNPGNLAFGRNGW